MSFSSREPYPPIRFIRQRCRKRARAIERPLPEQYRYDRIVPIPVFDQIRPSRDRARAPVPRCAQIHSPRSGHASSGSGVGQANKSVPWRMELPRWCAELTGIERIGPRKSVSIRDHRPLCERHGSAQRCPQRIAARAPGARVHVHRLATARATGIIGSPAAIKAFKRDLRHGVKNHLALFVSVTDAGSGTPGNRSPLPSRFIQAKASETAGILEYYLYNTKRCFLPILPKTGDAPSQKISEFTRRALTREMGFDNRHREKAKFR